MKVLPKTRHHFVPQRLKFDLSLQTLGPPPSPPLKKTKRKRSTCSLIQAFSTTCLHPLKWAFFLPRHALLPPQPAAVPPAVNCGPHVPDLSGRARPVHCRAPHHTPPSKAGQELPGILRLGVSLYCVVVWRRSVDPSGKIDFPIWYKERLHGKREKKIISDLDETKKGDG